MAVGNFIALQFDRGASFSVVNSAKSALSLVSGQTVGRHPDHTPCIAFRHLPPNSARTGYVTEGALFYPPRVKKSNLIRNNPVQRYFVNTPHRNNGRVARVTGSGCHSPCAGGHKTSRPDGPSHRRRCPRKAFAVAASLLECARSTERETAWLFLRFRYRRRSVGTTTPKESGEGQWPGFGLRWSVVEAQQWCGGYHPSPVVVTAPCRSHRPLSSSPPPVVVTAPCRRHRPRSSSPPPVVVTAPGRRHRPLS